MSGCGGNGGGAGGVGSAGVAIVLLLLGSPMNGGPIRTIHRKKPRERQSKGGREIERVGWLVRDILGIYEPWKSLIK